jgi:hypothetical protein
MSELPPTGPKPPPATPLPSQLPKIHYDGSGNPFFQDLTGRWVPYFGQFAVSLSYFVRCIN